MRKLKVYLAGQADEYENNWKDERIPKWSIEFVKKAGIVVNSVEKAIGELKRCMTSDER